MSDGEKLGRPPCPETLRARMAAAELSDALAAVRTRIARDAQEAVRSGNPLDGDVIQPLPFAPGATSRDRTSTDANVATAAHSDVHFEPVPLARSRRLFPSARRKPAWRKHLSATFNGLCAGAIAATGVLALGSAWFSDAPPTLAEQPPQSSVAATADTKTPPRTIGSAPTAPGLIPTATAEVKGLPVPEAVGRLQADPVLVRDIRSIAATQFTPPTPAAPILPPRPTSVVRLGPPPPDPSTTVTAAVREYRYTSATIDKDIVAPKPKLAGPKRKVRLPKATVRRAAKRIPPLRRVRPPAIGLPRWAERAFNRGD